jgi:hypothetical protein
MIAEVGLYLGPCRLAIEEIVVVADPVVNRDKLEEADLGLGRGRSAA